MRRVVMLFAVGGVIGAVAFLRTRRGRASMAESTPAPASAPVHMAVGHAAPEVPIPGETDATVSS